MIRLPNPWVILGVLAALSGAYFYGHHKGWYQRDAEMQAEIAKKNEESRAKEQEMQAKLHDNATQLQEANNALNQKSSALDRAIRAGRVRLPSPSCVQAPAGAAPAPVDRQEAGGQPDRPADPAAAAERATLAAIAEIVAQGDRNTAQLNACIDAYNQVMESVNGHR